MTIYLALLRKEDDSDYGVDFPDFPGCVTAGQTLAEARRMAAEALCAHIELMVEDGEEIPVPSHLDEVMKNSDNADAFPFPVPTHYQPADTRQIQVTLCQHLVAAIDTVTDDRSAFLAEATCKELRS